MLGERKRLLYTGETKSGKRYPDTTRKVGTRYGERDPTRNTARPCTRDYC